MLWTRWRSRRLRPSVIVWPSSVIAYTNDDGLWDSGPSHGSTAKCSDGLENMAERNDISGLLAFIGREGDWQERLQDVIAEHLMPALEEFEIDQNDLADLLGEQWSGVLWGCGFEDFLGQRYQDGNIVDLYLKRRGWKETALNQTYFAALRDTPVSLYEVSEMLSPALRWCCAIC